MASTFAMTGNGALAAAGASSQGAYAMTALGDLEAVAPASGNSIATWAGSGALVLVGAATGTASLAATGVGALSGVAVGGAPSVATLSGQGALAAVGSNTAASVATMTGVGTLAAAAVTKPTIARMTGVGRTHFSGSWSNNLPFNYPPSWSIMLYGDTIEGVMYDPVSNNIRVLFTDTFGQFIILGPFGISITNQIELSPDPEAYVLGLIR